MTPEQKLTPQEIAALQEKLDAKGSKRISEHNNAIDANIPITTRIERKKTELLLEEQRRAAQEIEYEEYLKQERIKKEQEAKEQFEPIIQKIKLLMNDKELQYLLKELLTGVKNALDEKPSFINKLFSTYNADHVYTLEVKYPEIIEVQDQWNHSLRAKFAPTNGVITLGILSLNHNLITIIFNGDETIKIKVIGHEPKIITLEELKNSLVTDVAWYDIHKEIRLGTSLNLQQEPVDNS